MEMREVSNILISSCEKAHVMAAVIAATTALSHLRLSEMIGAERISGGKD